jgi:hypothetical protein
MEVFLNSLHREILKRLSEKRLSSLKEPFKELVSLDCLTGKEFAYIKKITRDINSTRDDYIELFSKYFDKFGIKYTIKNQKRYEDKTIAKRVRKYTSKMKKNGYRQISGYLSKANYRKFQRLKQQKKLTNTELLNYLIQNFQNL